MRRIVASLLAPLASASMEACCGAVAFQSDPGGDGATVVVAARECSVTTTQPTTSVFLGSNEILRMNAAPEMVSLRWEDDGRTLVVSTPLDISSRDLFVPESTAARPTIRYETH